VTREEQLRFIEKELRGLWPKWAPTDAEIRAWATDLASFDYDLARAAADACFRGQTVNYQRPVLGRFLEQARALSRQTGTVVRQRPEPTTNVFIECLEAPPGKSHRVGTRTGVYVCPPSRQDDRDYVLARAECMRRKFEQLYGGRYITVTTKPAIDDGLRGQPARQKAYENTRNGPDTPTKRGLQRHRNRTSDPDDSPLLGDATKLEGGEFS